MTIVLKFYDKKMHILFILKILSVLLRILSKKNIVSET